MTEKSVVSLFKEKVVKPESSGKKMDKVEKDFEVKMKNKNISIEEGYEFIKNLKKEAGRQKAMKAAESLELQTRQVEFLPTVESVSEEIELADSFEIIEE